MYKSLSMIVDSQNDYKDYRMAVETTTKPPFIPILALWVQDLDRIYAEFPLLVDQKCVRLDHVKLVSTHVAKLRESLSIPFSTKISEDFKAQFRKYILEMDS